MSGLSKSRNTITTAIVGILFWGFIFIGAPALAQYLYGVVASWLL